MREARTIPHSHHGASRPQTRHEVGRWDNGRGNGKVRVEEARSLLSVQEAALARLRGTPESSWRNERTTGGNIELEMYSDHPHRQTLRGGGQEYHTAAGLNRTNARGPSVGPHVGYDEAYEFDDEEENVIVLCDTNLCCNEGAKNLCTLALWGIITLCIFNRFIVHFAGFLHSNKD